MEKNCIVNLRLYHGTLDLYVKSILENGFKQSDNLNYKDYLGKGIYFYDNYKLAEKWAYKKARRRGTGFAVIKANVKFQTNRCLNFTDAKTLNDFNEYMESFKREARRNGEVLSFDLYCKDSERQREELSWLIDCYCEFDKNVDIVIANLDVSDGNNRYLNDIYLKLGVVAFNEKQYCIKNSAIIKEINSPQINEAIICR